MRNRVNTTTKSSVIEDYSFDVMWRDEITAHVQVKQDKIIVARYCKHPVRQLFASEEMSRYQLNQILTMRCFDKNRPDAVEKLRALGLNEYNPQEIVRRTHGVSYNDYIWIRFPGEKISSKDVLVRK